MALTGKQYCNPTVPKPTPSDRIVGLVMRVNTIFIFSEHYSIFHA
jgi:hypothetical protein